MLMLIGLIFRAVAFEFRFKAKDDKRHLWANCASSAESGAAVS